MDPAADRLTRRLPTWFRTPPAATVDTDLSETANEILQQVDTDALERRTQDLMERYRRAVREEVVSPSSPEDADQVEARVDAFVDWTLSGRGDEPAHAVGLRLMRSVTADQQRDEDEQHRLGGGSRGFAVAVGWQPLESCKGEAVDFRRVAATAARRPRRRGAGRPAGARRHTTSSTRAGPGSSDDPPGEPSPAAPRRTLAPPPKTLYTFACLTPEQRGEA